MATHTSRREFVLTGLIAGRPTAQSQAARTTFAAEEATVSGILAALAAGHVTCVRVWRRISGGSRRTTIAARP
jgi:hypothetical protein